MKTMRIAPFAVLLSMGLFGLISCGEDTPAPVNANVPGPGVSRLNLQATANRQPVRKAGRTAAVTTLAFTSGSIIFAEVVFDADRVSDGRSISVTHEQVATLNFATGEITPPISVDVPAGEYKDVYLGIEIQDVNEVPGIVIEGTYTTTANVVRPIRFEFNSGEVFEAEAERVVLNEKTNVVTRISFDPQYWFGTITAQQLDNATVTNGRILISETSNVAIFNIVAQRIDDRTEADFD